MTAQVKIRVLVVDDHPSVRAGLSAVIRYQRDMQVVGQAGSAAEAKDLFESEAPDVTLVDLLLPDLNGIDLIRVLLKQSPTARFIILTANDGGSEIAKAMQAGAQAYLFKDSTLEELLAAIRTVFSGGRYMSPAVSSTADAAAAGPHMTARELQILSCIAKGYSNQQIAAETGATVATAKFHVKNIFAKLNVNSRSKAALLALRLGLVEPDTK